MKIYKLTKFLLSGICREVLFLFSSGPKWMVCLNLVDMRPSRRGHLAANTTQLLIGGSASVHIQGLKHKQLEQLWGFKVRLDSYTIEDYCPSPHIRMRLGKPPHLGQSAAVPADYRRLGIRPDGSGRPAHCAKELLYTITDAHRRRCPMNREVGVLHRLILGAASIT